MEFVKLRSAWLRRAAVAAAGALAGYAYYYYIGCVNGTCAITSNPYISTAYGAVIALLLAGNDPNKKKEETHGINNNTSQNI